MRAGWQFWIDRGGTFTAVVYARLRHFKFSVPVAVITLTGGIASSVFLMLSGILSWCLSRPDIADILPIRPSTRRVQVSAAISFRAENPAISLS